MKKSLLLQGILLSLGITATGSLFFLSNSPIAHATGSAPTVLSIFTGNSTSSVADDYITSGISLSAGGNTSVYVNGVVQDLDGAATITAVNAVFYKNDVSGGTACTPDILNCVAVSCNLFDGADANQKIYSCGINLTFNATATDTSSPASGSQWLPYVTVTDGTDTGTSNGNNVEVNSLLAITIPGTIDFGTRSIDTLSAPENNVETVLTQRGNREADVEVSMATGMGCTSGVFPLENLKWSLTDVGYSDASAFAISATPVDTNITIALGDATIPAPTKTLYWNLSVPFGVGGTCTGTTVISAIAH